MLGLLHRLQAGQASRAGPLESVADTERVTVEDPRTFNVLEPAEFEAIYRAVVFEKSRSAMERRGLLRERVNSAPREVAGDRTGDEHVGALLPSQSTARIYKVSLMVPDQPRRGGRKPEIRRVAAELFARQGYHATTVAEISAATGLGKGALYHYIGSKEELLFEVSSQHVIEMVSFGEALLHEEISAVEKFQRLSRRLMRTIADNLPELTVFFSEYRAMNGERGDQVHDLRKRFERIWAAILDEGVKEGVFRPVDPVVVKGLLGLHNYAYLWFHPDGRLEAEQIADAFCDVALRGLLTPEGAGSQHD